MRTVLLFLILAFFAAGGQPVLAFSGVAITEIMYDLAGADDPHEWIEIHNFSSSSVDLTDWRFNDGKNHLLLAPPENGGQGSLVISPGEYVIFADNAETFLSDHSNYSGSVIDTVLSLNNSSATLSLLNEEGVLINEFSYTSSIGGSGNGRTLERTPGDTLQESSTLGGTPGQQNGLIKEPTLDQPEPEPEILPEPEPKPEPDIADVATPIQPPGEEVSPQSENEAQDEPVVEQEPVVEPSAQESAEEPLSYSGLLQLSELLPNPSGKDTDEEFVELLNVSGLVVSLDGWALRDASGKTFRLFGDMPPGTFLAFFAANTSLPSLNNAGDVIELLDPLGIRQDGISYSKALEGLSLVFVDSVWRWSGTATPNKKNVVSSSVTDAVLGSAASPLAVAPPPPSATSSAPSPITEDDFGKSDFSQDSSFAAALHSVNRTSSGGSVIWSVLPLLALLAGAGVFVFRRRTQKRLSSSAPVFAVEETDSPPVT